jgi:hypothetical protein
VSDLLTLDGWGQRAEGFRFDLLDRFNSWIGDLTVQMGGASVTNNINRKVKRALNGLTLPPKVTAEINTLTERLRPWMVMQDGTEYPLGVFVFADATRSEQLYGSVDLASVGVGQTTTGALLDQLALLDEESRGVTFAAPGDSVYDLLVQQVEAGGIVEHDIEATDATVSEWMVWKAEATRLEIINDLAALAGFYSLYFDNMGVAVLRAVPSMSSVEPTLVYEAGRNVVAGSVQESDDLLAAPNVYLVLNSGMSSGPIWGEWKVPASAPHSEANRGRALVRKYDVQGVTSNGQAARMAKAFGQADYATYRWVNFSTAIDPRHDTFDVIGWKGEKYREQQWTLPLVAGGTMSHELRRVWSEDFADIVEEDA